MNNVVEFPRLYFRPRLTIDKFAGRFGHFYVTHAALENHPDLVLQIMAKVIVIAAGNDSSAGHIFYTAISQDFEVAEEGRAPLYEWVYEAGAMRARISDRRQGA